MSAQRYTALQICIICFLVFLLAGKALLRHPDWFDGEHDELYGNLGQDQSATRLLGPFSLWVRPPRPRTQASSITLFRSFEQRPAWMFTLRRLELSGLSDSSTR